MKAYFATQHKRHYAVCHYAKCHILFIVVLNKIMLGFVILNVNILSVILLYVVAAVQLLFMSKTVSWKLANCNANWKKSCGSGSATCSNDQIFGIDRLNYSYPT